MSGESAAFVDYSGHTRPGFFIRFENGYGVSVIWHQGAYADEGKTSCEVMAPFEEIGMANLGDSVMGWVTPEKLVEILSKTAALPQGVKR